MFCELCFVRDAVPGHLMCVACGSEMYARSIPDDDADAVAVALRPDEYESAIDLDGAICQA